MKLDLKTVSIIVTLVIGATVLLDRYNSKQEKTLQEQIQDDSAYARATRAVEWIYANGWKVTFIGPNKPKGK